MTVITMTREMGTLGKEVAREFARLAGFTVIHHELVESVTASRAEIDESEVYRFLEGTDAELAKWRGNRADGGFLTPIDVLKTALEGDVLIRGWGATRLLRSVPGILSVRVLAPIEFRVAQIQERLSVDARTAEHEIHRSDAAHGRTFLRFFEADWRDPSNYDLILNTAHMSTTDCAALLFKAASSPAFKESDETRQVLGDRLLEASIRAELKSRDSLQGSGRHIDVCVDHANVRLFGVVKDRESQKMAEEIVAARAGVSGIQNEIVQASGFGD